MPSSANPRTSDQSLWDPYRWQLEDDGPLPPGYRSWEAYYNGERFGSGPEWRRRRQLGIERRAEKVPELLARPLHLPPMPELSNRELEVVMLTAKGLTLAEAADVLQVHKGTVQRYWDRARTKMRGSNVSYAT